MTDAATIRARETYVKAVMVAFMMLGLSNGIEAITPLLHGVLQRWSEHVAMILAVAILPIVVPTAWRARPLSEFSFFGFRDDNSFVLQMFYEAAQRTFIAFVAIMIIAPIVVKDWLALPVQTYLHGITSLLFVTLAVTFFILIKEVDAEKKEPLNG